MALSGRIGTLLVAVPGLSGVVYPEGTRVTIQGTGGSVDGFVDGDWLPLAWWEFADVRPEDATG
ncbi:hypothetical protein [Streptomyces afghaniensis]|uniref:Uncharacterized protein n=1 Tax=Streptomyces chartreusis NRRL 3882 TaxID=1079985 RepID=A0A2N9BD08_STRCX|nr:hypothetical protein [Streptomyces afghaniensis]MYS90048.1 hypothetical protein [Streptomyces sp. SID5464]SOR81245.1 hypothetical protein SCNRRL3882_4697 [Streptomyces chartreusis NRRL 3882]